jgi:DNA polymerase (family 10)
MTKRIIRAISNPNVTMLGHISGRLLLAREPYKIDIAAVIDAAAETGTIIELNCSPQRLELDWRWWPRAKEKGVKCSVNPDAHRLDAFGYVAHGVELARKGWLTRDDVVNTLPLGKIEEVLAEKRSKAGRSGG